MKHIIFIEMIRGKWKMKRISQLSLMMIAVFLLVACGSLPTEAPGGLTSSMAANQTESSAEKASSPYMELKSARCEGTMDSETNLLQVSFQLASDAKDLGTRGDQVLLFGGGTGLFAQLGKVEPGSYAISCDGEITATAMPLKANNETVSWLTGLKTSQLLLTSPSGEKIALKDVLLHGLTAKSDKEIPGILESVYGVSMKDGYQSFFATQKLLIENYPATDLFEERALKSGMSKGNVDRFLAMSSEKDVEEQRALLLDIVTTENETYIETVLGTTIKSLLAVGASPKEISNFFQEETNGRITVQFSDDNVGSAADLTVKLTNQDNSGNVAVTAYSDESSSNGGNPGGDTGDNPGGNTGDNPGGDTSDNPDGGTGDNPDGGTDDNPDGGTGDNPDGGGGRTWGSFFRDLGWNIFMGAAAGATLGAPEGGVGAFPGAAGGALAGGIYTIAGGFYDPFPDDPNSPCQQPGVEC